MEVRERIASIVRRERKQLDISQKTLSIELGRDANYIWRIENCGRDLNLVEFLDLMRALNLNAGEAAREVRDGLSKLSL